MILRHLFGLLALLSAAAAVHAQQTCLQYQVTGDHWSSGWHATPAAACAAMVGKSKDAGGGYSYTVSSAAMGDPYCNMQVTTINPHIPPSTQPGQGQVTSRSGECDSCKDKMGKDTTINWTVGYSRYDDENHPNGYDLVSKPNTVPSDGSMCMQGCKISAEVGNPIAAYRSVSPTPQGLYRLSIDYPAQHLGEACMPGPQDQPANPEDAMPTCKGSLGTVNGKPHCAGTATDPVRNDTPTDKPAKGEEGNPRAGEKPGSGEGSGNGGAGRTPSQGNGGPGGGPAGAAGTGKGPDGTTNKPTEGKEQAACGAPGQPKCKIDETGTPEGKDVFDAAKKQLEDADKSRKDAMDGIKSRDDKDTSWGQSLGWVQHGGCVPWELGTLPLGAGIPISVDICPIMPYIEWVTSFLWALATFAMTLAMVFRVTTASAS